MKTFPLFLSVGLISLFSAGEAWCSGEKDKSASPRAAAPDGDIPAATEPAEDKAKIALEMASFFRAARAVLSDNQGLINNASLGDKGITGETVVAAAKMGYQKSTGSPAPIENPKTLSGRAAIAMVSSVREVMDKAQPLINEMGRGFKGFLPAVFARQTAESFSKKMDGKIFIKLTAPKNYLRNRANTPDEWENHVIETKFKSPAYEKGKAFSEMAPYKGKPAYRLIIPEFYGPSCLSCHGDPKGEIDITGGKKEGAVLNELGGAVSVAIVE